MKAMGHHHQGNARSAAAALRKQIAIGSLLVLAGSAAHARAESGLRCEKVHRHGLTEKVITYTSPDGKTYALNGYARLRARSHHWIRATHALPPEQAADLLSRGLKLCDSLT
ncbi:hypothetical protein P3W85_40260 [Cupriavidus basilensis]|uniref:Uncharacterized protein n=1 Tax=Cupriavidus basilensis TaxID=68895 RepID=A0ABT6B3Q5_9BURK|nr:hypothetical protein [Cupriavidus basilensis]MDF3839127.1 hypothetical protein [Cupriavidus basilensis]